MTAAFWLGLVVGMCCASALYTAALVFVGARARRMVREARAAERDSVIAYQWSLAQLSQVLLPTIPNADAPRLRKVD